MESEMIKKRICYFYLFLLIVIPTLSAEDKRIIHYDSYLNPESLIVIIENGDQWSIYQRLDEDTTNQSNGEYGCTLVHNYFGPMPGIKNSNWIIGWNNQNIILYIEILSTDVMTIDGLKIGMTKEDVIEALGVPFIEYEDRFRYQNSENEVCGILFVFDDDGIIERIILFAYV